MLLKIVILLIIILITVLHIRYKNISEKFEDIRKDVLIKSLATLSKNGGSLEVAEASTSKKSESAGSVPPNLLVAS